MRTTPAQVQAMERTTQMAVSILPTLRRLVAPVLFVTAGCGATQSDDAGGAEAAVATLRAMDSALSAAVAARDPERTAGFYADNAVLMPVAEPIVEGRDAIREEWRHVFGIPGFTNTSRLVALEPSQAGDLAYLRGVYESPMLGPDGQQVIERGKWLSVWKRQADGAWRIVADIFNTDAPPPDHQRSTAAPRTP